ncbi:uncharacterized protein A4U43_C07F26050 [Asparagus officinalis]|uniref:Uncharacterized protein n=1 Tax=Asparagus officinalis TaxID=4686 RepID=A0A5P1EEZ4_ASPOF|nr:uncharacterized protein A4U43_C07F26050 [Asparagus officinalis]
MFEGFVSQVLLGYLGRYVKGIQKDQLKIGLWREEVLLENVELILEAFDYLQLPFALKTGKVGKLSIKVPWKKLGWEPIIVALEDVFICACQREEDEWSSDSVERRELAGKMAKLNAIELAKFSRRVSDNPAGQSFLSYIYAKILDNIQVSIKNVRIIYNDSHNNKGNFVFGLRFSILTMTTDNQKQSSSMSVGRLRSGQVNKSVEISNIWLYCNLLEDSPGLLGVDGTAGSQLSCDLNIESERYDYLINPFDVSISLLVNKTGKLDGGPQYALIAELTNLVVSLNENQLQQILSFWDYLSICALREKYGRYRPPQDSLSQKLNGWQRMWWRYALESVLADVRKKLKKTSWSNFGRRISQCRRYVNLYKRKLELLQQEQLINKDILTELEKMDKECDIDDILNFRCLAEQELQDLLSSRSSNMSTNDYVHYQAKQHSTDQLANRERGWLNWLSLGMLGAGGTADSSSFAGVITDEIIKDIYDATEFHPMPSSGGDSSESDKLCSFSIKLNICQILFTISTRKLNRTIANAILDGIDFESKVWEDSVSVLAAIGSVKIINPCDDLLVLKAEAVFEENSPLHTVPFLDIQVNLLQPKQASEISVKVMLQPFEVTCGPGFFLDLLHFYNIMASFQLQQDRVLHSLNGLRSFPARLLSKTEYMLFNRKKVNWDVTFMNVVIKLPFRSEILDNPIMYLELGSLFFKSRYKMETGQEMLDNFHCYDHVYEGCFKNSMDDVPLVAELQSLYNHYTIELTEFEVRVPASNICGATSIIEKLNANIGFRLCMFFDEPTLKALEVDCILPSVRMQISPAAVHALVGVRDKLLLQESEGVATTVSDGFEKFKPDDCYCFRFFVSVKLDQLSLGIILEEDAPDSPLVSFFLKSIDFKYIMQEDPECHFYVKFLKAEELKLKGESTAFILCSLRDEYCSTSSGHFEQVGPCSPSVTCSEDSPGEGCFKFKYYVRSDGCKIQHECSVFLNAVDLHIHPRIFGYLHGFYSKVSKQSFSSAKSFNLNQQEDTETFDIELSKSGFSDFYDTDPTTYSSNRVDHFPFVNIYNSGSLSCLEGSLIGCVPKLPSSYVNDRHQRIQTFKFQKKRRTYSYATVESPSSTGTVSMERDSCTVNMFLLDISISNLRVHFHDSSCILGTITLSKCGSSIISQDSDGWDARICTDGVMLSSSWSPPSIHDQLWSPALPSVSPALNIRLRKKRTGTLSSMTEVSFGVQYICCILPSSFLAMMIGYFSLPDWTSKGNEDVINQCASEIDDFENVQSCSSAFLYKFEILHSRLILPVESQPNFCLQLGLSQLYFASTLMSSIVDADKDIPSSCAIPSHLTADKLDIINLFGRNLSLSLIPLKGDAGFLLKADEYSRIANVPLIEQLDADLWVRIPCTTNTCPEQSALPTSIMMRVCVCNLIAEDRHLVLGIRAIRSVIEELSSIGEESKFFSSDVLQFLQIRKTLKEAKAVTLDTSNRTLMNIKLCADTISIRFSRFWIEESASEMMAKINLQLNVSASLEKGVLRFLDIDIPCLLLHSINTNRPLASFVSDSSLISHLHINFSESDCGKKELLFSIPFLDVWLHLSEWNNFIDVLSSYSKFDSASNSSAANPESIYDGDPGSQVFNSSASEDVMEEDIILIIKSENSAIALHLPFWDKEEHLGDPKIDEVSKRCKYVNFSLQSRCCEFTIGKTWVKLQFNMEKVRAILEMVHDQNISSMPFILISQIKLETNGQKRQGELMHFSTEVHVESVDVGLSYQIFNFWSNSELQLPERSSSPFPCHCIVCHVHLRKGSLLLSDGRAIFRAKQMIADALKQLEAAELRGILGFHSTEDVHTRRYAPYILQNDTSLPLTFHVSRGSISTDDTHGSLRNHQNIVEPGYTVPIYVEETADEQYFRHGTAYSSERLIEKKVNALSHHMISIHLEGTTGPSKPMSMDLVGLSCFEVNFSNDKQSEVIENERGNDTSGFNRMTGRYRSDQNKGLVVPVVFEVSMQHYSKMIRLYSTVILFNSTSMPLELRFDIPFGVSSKILDPILPGEDIPLPLHLAEAGRMRWRPVGNSYLWSEAHSLLNILSQEYKLGFLRSFVCYPAQPTSDPFRCCISVQDYSLSPSGGPRKHSSLGSQRIRRETVNHVNEGILEPGITKKHLIREIRLTTPFVVHNYLPLGLSLMVESSGVAHSISVKEADVASVFHVDSTNDLGVTLHMQGYMPIGVKFPRVEAFSSTAKLNGLKYYLSETLALFPETSSGPTYVTVEKVMDVFSGAREIFLYVSFLLYNCTGLTLSIVDGNHEGKGTAEIIPSSYHLIEDEYLLSGKQGIPLISSGSESSAGALGVNSHTISIREKSSLHLHKLLTRHFPFPFTYRHYRDYSSSSYPDSAVTSVSSSVNGWPTKRLLHYSRNSEKKDVVNENHHTQIASGGEVKPFMYCPLGHIPASVLIVKLCAHMPQCISGNVLCPTWSSPFPLVPESGSANVVIPKPNGSGAFLISASSIPVEGELSGRTRAITFQPRYVICNACNQELCYKQKGTNEFYRLGVGQHSHLHWSDTSRELCVSIRFNTPGWQWSGSFLPDYFGDVQVKMRNYVSETSHMVRVEVQNADLAIRGKKIKTAGATSSTQLIIISDDKSGFMPYRIDNFSMERLRVYQQRCEFFETTVHAYTSAHYAWDEPCYPHRLVVEVPGERILGTYTLDSEQEYLPIYLPTTSEKAERRLYVSVHAEGAIKVLRIIDSSYHIIKDVKETGLLGLKEKKNAHQKHSVQDDYSEVIKLHFPFIGISLINSSPQELVFACARETVITVMQSLGQQKVSFQILTLQIDSQFPDSLYPIILSFDNEHRGRSANFMKNMEHTLRMQNENASPTSENTNESALHFTAVKWRNTDASLFSFKYIHLRLSPLCIELEEQVLLNLLDFFRVVSLRLQSKNLQNNFETRTEAYGIGVSRQFPANHRDHMHIGYNVSRLSKITDTDKKKLLPSVFPIGTPWQQIYLSAKRQKKMYIEVLELAPIKLSLSFTSTPWMIRNEVQTGVQNLPHISSTTFQRSLMALVDVEGVPVHLGELVLGHLMASRESIEEMVTKHYTRQLLHEMYKVFGSAGVIGNPIGFARNVGLGIKDFLSVSSKEIVHSPIGLLNGIAQGSKSLLSNTIYAISSATTQFTKTAHKGIVALTFDEQTAAEMDMQLKSESHGRGILSEFFEGLTGLLQSPIRGAEKHGLPGVVSGIAMGTAGLVARPMASILEATGKTAQSIRKRSNPHQSKRLRIRFPRPLARELPLLPYSWEEAIGVSMLLQADASRLRDEIFVMCKTLRHPGNFIIITERLVFSVCCSCLVDLDSPEFVGVAADPEWVIETEMSLESIVHIDRTGDALNIVGSNAETTSRQKKGGMKESRAWKTPISAPLFNVRVEFRNQEEAEDVLQVLLSTIDQSKERRRSGHLLLRSNLRFNGSVSH